MTVFRASAIVHSTDPQGALHRYERLFAAHPTHEFQIPGRDLAVTVFAGFSVLSGSAEALAPVRDLRATVFVSSLKEVEALLVETGWTREGTIGSSGGLLAHDPDGNLLEFVEEPADETGSRDSAKGDLPGPGRGKPPHHPYTDPLPAFWETSARSRQRGALTSSAGDSDDTCVE